MKAAYGIYLGFAFPVLKLGKASHSSLLDVANILGHTFAQTSSVNSYSYALKETNNREDKMPLNFTDRASRS